MKEYLIFCTECNEYTGLGQYLPKSRRFQGEYSLLYNRYNNDHELLCQFLIRHLGHHLKTLQNQTEDYSQILRAARRFLDHEIDDYVHENIQRMTFLELESKRQLSVSHLHFDILERVLEEEAQTISKIPTQSPAESQFWLGKEQGVRRASELIKEWKGKLVD